MAAHSLRGNNDDKENIPCSSSAKAVVASLKVRSDKKKKLRLPLQDVTNLYYPGRVRSLQGSQFVLDAPSVFLLAFLVCQMENRRRKPEISKSRDFSSASATLRKHFR